MPKIKIVKVWSSYCDNCDYNHIAREPLSDWLEISQEELDQLSDYRVRDKILRSINSGYSQYSERIVVYEELSKEESVIKIESVKKMLDKINREEEAALKKRQLAAKKKAETQKERALQKARKVLEEAGEL